MCLTTYLNHEHEQNGLKLLGGSNGIGPVARTHSSNPQRAY